MRRVSLLLAMAGSFAVGMPAAEAAGASLAPATTGNLVVLLDQGHAAALGRSSVEAVIAGLGARPAGKSVPQIGLFTLRPALGVSSTSLMRSLRRLPGVESVQTERRYAPRSVPDDPSLSTPSAYTGVIQWGLAREGFHNAWDITKGDGALVGVVDTGIDASHPDLRTKIAAAITSSSRWTPPVRLAPTRSVMARTSPPSRAPTPTTGSGWPGLAMTASWSSRRATSPTRASPHRSSTRLTAVSRRSI